VAAPVFHVGRSLADTVVDFLPGVLLSAIVAVIGYLAAPGLSSGSWPLIPP
jgi:uncharacterized membrane protein